jgi:hypothetical protein
MMSFGTSKEHMYIENNFVDVGHYTDNIYNYSVTKNDDRITLLELFQLLEIYSDINIYLYTTRYMSLTLMSTTTYRISQF